MKLVIGYILLCVGVIGVAVILSNASWESYKTAHCRDICELVP